MGLVEVVDAETGAVQLVDASTLRVARGRATRPRSLWDRLVGRPLSVPEPPAVSPDVGARVRALRRRRARAVALSTRDDPFRVLHQHFQAVGGASVRAFLPVLALVACGDPGTDVPTAEAAVEVRTWVEGKPEGGVGLLKMQVEADRDARVALPEPEIPGLRVTEVDEPVREPLGDRVVITRTFRFTGDPGSYRIPPVELPGATDTDPPRTRSAPIWVDVGQPSTPLDGLADIDEPAPVFRLTPAVIVGGVCAPR